MFNVGDMAVYPAHGVGKIESMTTRKVGANEQSFYVMRIIESSMIVMIPIDSCQSAGLRNIIPPSDVEKVYEILQDKFIQIEAQPWNQRYREYMERIKTGSVFEIARVLRDLYTLREDKPLSFGERKMLDTARSLLVKELALAKQVAEGIIEEKIELIFS